MATFGILGEMLPVLGTVGLLGLWLYQQLQIERRTSELRKLEQARSVYQVYQSHNAVLNAVHELTNAGSVHADKIRNFQVYNYELGLLALEDVLTDDEKKGIPPAPNAYSDQPFSQKMEITQRRLETLQVRRDKKEEMIRLEADSAKMKYLWLYVALSVVSIMGAAFKIVSGLATH
jgi:hypothetical protein